MPDSQLRRSSQSDLPIRDTVDSTSADYTIRRKGSRYNIIGPTGRIFNKYKSASVVGPRWEELTHTPWPYQSSAYQPGTRLWQLGIIDQDEMEDKTISTAEEPARVAQKPAASAKKTAKQEKVIPFVPSPRARPAGLPSAQESPAEAVSPAETDVKAEGREVGIAPRKGSAASRKRTAPRPKPALAPEGIVVGPASPLLLALPAPRINLAEQERLIGALRHDPALLFNPRVRQALIHEVEYHRPYARWAQHLLKLLAKYDRRQQRSRPVTQRIDSTNNEVIMAKHIAWQEQQARMPAIH